MFIVSVQIELETSTEKKDRRRRRKMTIGKWTRKYLERTWGVSYASYCSTVVQHRIVVVAVEGQGTHKSMNGSGE